MLKRMVFVALAAMLSQAVSAQDEGDPERGRDVAYTCFGCHGIPQYKNVYPTYTVPKLGGQTYGYIVSALQAYRSGDRQHPTMVAQVNTLSEKDIRDIAAYFSSLDQGGER
jgi:cytochrome c553